MALASRLFADDPRLQACSASDASHVTPGASGEHVVRIQSALVRLRVLDANDARVESGRFGSRTADAILTYKRAFKIVNQNYQTQADSVVGRMTIASLDHAIWTLDGGQGPTRLPAWPGPHPQSPSSVAAPPKSANTAPPVATPTATPPVQNTSAFVSPLADLPSDMQDTMRRCNDAKKPGELLLYPFIGKDEGPLSGVELSARFGAANSGAVDILKALYRRMKPFNIWANIKIIINVYQGIGAKGVFCEPFNHDSFFTQMEALTSGPRSGPDPAVVPLSVPLMDSKFCRDAFNVHGPRDSFREMVKQGEGLHICIAQLAVRSTTSCDLHIDEIQQGQVCSRGYCIPIINGQTIDHLKTVGPWLGQEAKKWLPKF